MSGGPSEQAPARGEAPAQAPVAVRPVTPADTPAVLAVLERAFGFPADPERYDWVYARNAGGAPATSFLAELEGRVVGFHGALPLRLWHRGREVRGMYTLEVVTDPEVQGRGVFGALGRAIVEGARRDGIQLIRIFPNLNSAPGFYRKLGYTELTPFPVLGRLIGHTRGPVAARKPALAPLAAAADALLALGLLPARARAARLRQGGARIVPVAAFGAWADQLWESLRDGVGIATVRDAAWLRWRYLDGPHRYAILGVDRGAGPEAFAVVSVRPWKGGRAAELMELMARPGDRAAAELLLAEAVLHAHREGAVALRTWVSPRHPHRQAFRRAGFRPLPQRLARDYSFGVQVLDEAAVDAAEVTRMDGWTLTTGDIEYI